MLYASDPFQFFVDNFPSIASYWKMTHFLHHGHYSTNLDYILCLTRAGATLIDRVTRCTNCTSCRRWQSWLGWHCPASCAHSILYPGLLSEFIRNCNSLFFSSSVQYRWTHAKLGANIMNTISVYYISSWTGHDKS